MKSKTLIEKQTKKKTNTELVKTIFAAKKSDGWFKIAGILSGPRRKRVNINLEELNKKSKEGESIVIPGKVLSQGEINKKIKVVALNFSERAKDKLLKAGCGVSSIFEEIKTNPNAKGVKVLK